MILLKCPNCGARNVSEFRYGGEMTKRPNSNSATQAELADYLYMRNNMLGVMPEWWCHQSGCGQWFIAERHTKTHDVLKTYIWEARPQE